LGYSPEWSSKRAEHELSNVMADVRRRLWRPPEDVPPQPPAHVPTFHVFASEWIAAREQRGATKGRRSAGPRLADVATEWLEHGERKRGLKHSTLKDYRCLINTHLLPTFGGQEVGSITRGDIEHWHAAYERTRTAGKVLMVLGAILRYAQRRELITNNGDTFGDTIRRSADAVATVHHTRRRARRHRAIWSARGPRAAGFRALR